jgi:hypothetical protein
MRAALTSGEATPPDSLLLERTRSAANLETLYRIVQPGMQKQLGHLHTAVEVRQLLPLQRAAPILRGTLQMLEATDAIQALRDLDDLAASSRWVDADAACRDLSEAIDQLDRDIHALIERHRDA